MSILPHIIEPHTEMDAVEVQENFIALVDALSALSTKVDGVATGVDAKLVNFKKNIDGNIDASIDTLDKKVDEEIEALNLSKIEATVNGNSIKFSNGILINWGSVGGMGNGSWANLTWATPFVGGYVTGGSATYQQWAGDKGSSWAITDHQPSYISIRSDFEQSGGHTIWVIAIGRWK